MYLVDGTVWLDVYVLRLEFERITLGIGMTDITN